MAKEFKTEILEEITTNSNLDAQNDLFQNEKNDPPTKTLDTPSNDTGGNDTELQGQKETTTGEHKGQANESNASEGQKKKNWKGAGRKPLTEEQRAERVKERATGNKSAKEPVKAGKVKDAKSNLLNDLDKYKNIAPVTGTSVAPKTNEIDLGKYISGALLLICLDAVLPGIILFIAGWVDVKYKNVKHSKLKMTKEERKEIEPLADEIVKVLFGFVHPSVAFLVAMAAIYAGKLFTLDDEDFIKK